MLAENNKVEIIGRVLNTNLDHTVMGENFFKSTVEVLRLSGESDRLPVLISDRLIDPEAIVTGTILRIVGEYRSYNKKTNSGSNLILNIFAKEAEVLGEDCATSTRNVATLDGFICKQPIYRKTPLGREVTDLLLAVNRAYKKSDYIPCIAWGRNARFVSGLEVGERVRVLGRIQSRTYEKKYPDGTTEEKTAYELSISKIEKEEKEEE